MSWTIRPFVARLRCFAGVETGSMALFGLFIFLLMLMLGGLAVDVMRHEQRRTDLQNTLDRSVLAAASLKQTIVKTSADAEKVVRDYFAKAEMSPYLTSVTATVGTNERVVSAKADAELDPFFMPLLGIEDVNVPAVGRAEQRITNVEIVLVLDVSGSMLENSRLVNLKTAAKEFIDTVLGGDTANRVSLSLVPFNGQVNLGPNLINKFTNVQYPHGTADVNCVDLPTSVYASLGGLARNTALPRTAHADTYSTTTQNNSWVSIQGHTLNSNNKPSNNWCPPSTGNIVAVSQNSVSGLKAKIDALEGIGATSINAGMRWGMTLLDPANKAIYADLIATNQVPSVFSNRPLAWDDKEAMKVIVLMTDGSHFAEDRVNNDYKSGDSPIWYSSTANNFVIQHTTGRPQSAGSNEWWNPSSGSWTASRPNGYTQQTWPQVWARARVQWVAWQLYARALGTSNSTRTTQFNNAMSKFRTQTAISTMDGQLDSMCDIARERGVVVYGIAFEAPAAGQTAIKNCASSEAFYYNAKGLEISTVFRSIASNLSQLRLTQ